ncbi:MAG: ABC transporter permease [bacterium]
MLKNYLKIAFRNLLKHKGYTLLNVAGLAIGMACCILILLYVQDELSYDRHHEKADRIYRVAADLKFGGYHHRLAVAPAPLAAALVRDYAEVVAAARFRDQGSSLVKKEGAQNFKEERVIFADNAVFEIFTLPFLSGDAKTALVEPDAVVITATTAKKYFGENSALGQALIFDNAATYKITGVIADMPANSHFHFDLILSLTALEESRNEEWGSNNFTT